MSSFKFIFPLVVSSLLLGCSSSKSEDEADAHSIGTETKAGAIEEDVPDFNMEELPGMYSGDFGNGFINVIITYASEHKAVGYNIHKGLQRNISGDVNLTKDEIILTLAEPGDHKFDGKFEIHLKRNDVEGGDLSGTGTWTANDKQYGTKSLKLKKYVTSDEDEDSMDKAEKEDMMANLENQITQENFLDYFGSSTFDDGDFDFTEDGLVVFHYFPDGAQRTYRKQEVTINGSWKFKNKNEILVGWQTNTYFKKSDGRFLIQYDKENGYPMLSIEGHEIYPLY